MNKRILMVSLLAILGVSSLCWAAPAKAGLEGSDSGNFTGAAYYQRLHTVLDFIADAMEGLELKFNDARVSPIVQSEEWYEFPIEIGFLSGESKLVPALKKLLGFSFADSRLVHGAISISVCAPTSDDGQAMLAVNHNQKLMCGPVAEFPVVRERNSRIIRVFTNLLSLTTFTPQVEKKIQGGGLGMGKTWITNVRLDQDDRIQLTGYTVDFKKLTKLGDDLLKSGSFVEVFISNMSKNIFEKVPVWRFDMTARIK
ncbi:MAG: PilN domain-containing protein [Candidatus Ozemobacteraceae bacterium]